MKQLMWISTKAQYGMRALVEVAVGGDRPTSLRTVAERQALSHQYLEQIFAVMRKAGLVESVRGAHGGYRLARRPDAIDALEVVELLEGSVAPVTCIDDESSCDHVGACSTEPLWREVDRAVRAVLSSTTVADLMRDRTLLQIEPLPREFAGSAR
ncbi:MAG: Rrf2 family transcriptional regulator [Trueperaceae bacterium]